MLGLEDRVASLRRCAGAQAAMTKYHGRRGLNKRICSLTVLEATSLRSRCLARLVFSERKAG